MKERYVRYLGSNNVHPQQFTDHFIKNFSVKVKKIHFSFFAKNMRKLSEFLELFKKIYTWGILGPK